MRILTSLFAAALAMLFSISLAPVAQAAIGQITQHTIKIGTWPNRETRTYYVYEARTRGPQAPLILGFHGGGSDGATFMQRGWIQAAEAMGAVLIFPSGLSGSWNHGGDMTRAAERDAGDDMALLDALAHNVVPTYDINLDRVFAAGMSAGGAMSYRLVCERPGWISAVGIVAGAMQVSNCPGAVGASVMHIHGTADSRIPFNGGSGGNSTVVWNSTSYAMGTFVAANGCNGAPTVTQVAQDSYLNDYTPCSNGEEVGLIVVQGGPHNFDTSPYLNEVETLVNFFQRH